MRSKSNAALLSQGKNHLCTKKIKKWAMLDLFAGLESLFERTPAPKSFFFKVMTWAQFNMTEQAMHALL